MRKRTIYFLTITVLFFGANFLVAHISSQTNPFSLRQMLNAVAAVKEGRITQSKIISDIRKRKVDFPLTKENEKSLRDEGATDEIIEAIRRNSPPITPTPTAKPSLSPVSTPTPIPNYTPTVINIPKTFKNSIGVEFVKIPSGSFMMGSDKYDNEKPVHRVTINYEFYMGKYEVAIGEWKKLIGDIPVGMRTDLDNKFKESDLQPVINVSWDEAKEFIKKLNAKNDGYVYRLPSEAEWEYAARAGTTTEFAFGDNLSSNEANFDDSVLKRENLRKTTEVGSYKPNSWGVYDMHGNVWEWVEDIHSDDYNFSTLPINGSPNLSIGNSTMRITRGGSWYSFTANFCRSAYRSSITSTARNNNVGFRLVAYSK